jgi:hypothetical protein
MTYKRVAYDDASTPSEMASDSRAVGITMHLPRQVKRLAMSALDAVPDGLVPPAPAPVRKATIAVSDAAARLAGRFLD